jgi:putative ubiquitin-RnfH superfamily antitoxin RatB of RatAB toxin-antitoxin module
LPEQGHKHCLLAVDAKQGPILCPLSLPAAADVAAALREGRRQLQISGEGTDIDWQGAATGIWGVRCDRDAVPRDGDRIELYRPLSADPRHRRRQRVRAARRP